MSVHFQISILSGTVLCDKADSRETAPSLCFMTARSCCLAAFKDAMSNCSSTMSLTAVAITEVDGRV